MATGAGSSFTAAGGELPASPVQSSPSRGSSFTAGGELPVSPVQSSPSHAASRTGSLLSSPAALRVQDPSPFPELTPIQIAKLGYEQKVVIPMQFMLKKVMASLKSPSEPIFKSVKVGESAYIAYVQLDVSTTRVRARGTEPIVTIDGQECPNAYLAEESAARNAFDYLERRHSVFVLDYSKHLAQQTRVSAPFGQVNSIIHEVEDAVVALHASIARVEKLHSEVHAKEFGESATGFVSSGGKLYKEVRVFLDTLLQRYTEKYRDFLSGVKAFEDDRTKYHDECNERVRTWARKGLLQPGWVTEKDVLEYLLAYFGINEAEYWKEIVDGRHIGYVRIDFGDLDEINCYGNTIFRGYTSSSSKDSEQYAAAAALKEIEKIMNVTIVDFNRDDRVAAEKEHMSIVGLLNHIINLAFKVKVQCTDMLDTIKCACEVYGCGPEKFSSSPLTNDQVCALNFCAQGLAKLQSHLVEKLEIVAAKIDQIQKYCPDED